MEDNSELTFNVKKNMVNDVSKLSESQQIEIYNIINSDNNFINIFMYFIQTS